MMTSILANKVPAFAAGAGNASGWMTPERAAKYLSVERRTILLWARQGMVKGHVLSGTRRITWRFLRSDLDAKLTSPSVALRTGGFNESTE